MFFGTHDNKIDRKGRVSVPASFRGALGGPADNSIVLFPSFTDPTIEAWTVERMERLQAGLDQQMDQFSDEQRHLASLVFAESRLVNCDNDGRILLPAELSEHARLDGQALFVGQGATFQMWQPAAYQTYKATARERAAQGGMTVRLAPAPENRGDR